MNNKLLIYALIVIVVIGLGYYYMKSYSGGQSPGTATPNAMVGTAPSASTSPIVVDQTINIAGSEFAFTPSAITVKQGQTIQIIFTNNGTFPHNLTISDLNVQTKTIEPGQSDTVTFTASKVGTFSFICSIPTHADRGMKGTLTVQ